MSADLWQWALLACAALFLLGCVWNGWRLGLVRQLIALAAAAFALVCGIVGAHILVPVLRTVLPFPDRVLALAAGVVTGVVVFLTLTLFSAIIFRKTSDQGVGIVRWGYGLTGALVGAVYGLFLLGLAAIGLRFLGSIAEAELALSRGPASSSRAHPAAATSRSMLAAAASVKQALNHGLTGTLLDQIDPLPASFQPALEKFRRVLSTPGALDRFMQYPATRRLLDHPKVARVTGDPDLRNALARQQPVAALSNPHVVAAANDPEVVQLLEDFEWQKALDYALRKPEKGAARHAP